MSTQTRATAPGARSDGPVGTETGRRVFPWGRDQLGVLLAALVGLVGAFSAAGFLITGPLDGTWPARLEARASRWVEQQRSPVRNDLAHWGSTLSDTLPKVVAILLVSALCVYAFRRWHDALFLIAVMTLEVSVFGAVSRIVGRERPPIEQLDGAPTTSFPSGHAAAALAFYVALAMIVSWHTRSRGVRAVFWALAVVAPLTVATSRFYLGMHYLSDLLAGFVLGALCLVIVHRLLEQGLVRVDPDAPAHTRRLDLDSSGGFRRSAT